VVLSEGFCVVSGSRVVLSAGFCVVPAGESVVSEPAELSASVDSAGGSAVSVGSAEEMSSGMLLSAVVDSADSEEAGGFAGSQPIAEAARSRSAARQMRRFRRGNCGCFIKMLRFR
jgi:hypothetical protein